ncbi:MAG: hypothetical protein U0353_12735 [Sandaracinus sp.]
MSGAMSSSAPTSITTSVRARCVTQALASAKTTSVVAAKVSLARTQSPSSAMT